MTVRAHHFQVPATRTQRGWHGGHRQTYFRNNILNLLVALAVNTSDKNDMQKEDTVRDLLSVTQAEGIPIPAPATPPSGVVTTSNSSILSGLIGDKYVSSNKSSSIIIDDQPQAQSLLSGRTRPYGMSGSP